MSPSWRALCWKRLALQYSSPVVGKGESLAELARRLNEPTAHPLFTVDELESAWWASATQMQQHPCLKMILCMVFIKTGLVVSVFRKTCCTTP